MTHVKNNWRTIPGFVRVGICGKTHGAHGELKLRIDHGREEDCMSSAFLFVDLQGCKVPVAIEKARLTKELLVRFSGVYDNSNAAKYVGREIFLPNDEVAETVEAPPSDLVYFELIGMTIFHNDLEVGEITEILEYPQQEMAVILRKGAELFIPLNSELIESVDEDKKHVYMNLPEGLLDL